MAESEKDHGTRRSADAAHGNHRKSDPPASRRPAARHDGQTAHRPMPRWLVTLHNDETNDMHWVVQSILLLTPLMEDEAVRKMLEAHRRGRAMLLCTHRERAELYRRQFSSRNLIVSIKPVQG